MRVLVRQVQAISTLQQGVIAPFYAPKGLDDFTYRIIAGVGVEFVNTYSDYRIRLSGEGPIKMSRAGISGEVTKISVYNDDGMAITFKNFHNDINDLLDLLGDWQFGSFSAMFWDQPVTLSYTSTRVWSKEAVVYFANTEFDLPNTVLQPLVFLGTRLADGVNAGGGADRIYGHGGDDIVFGQAGRDLIYGGAGHDRIDSGEGYDRVEAGNGNDTVIGNMGRDTIYGGNGDDNLAGQLSYSLYGPSQGPKDKRDRLYGEDGNDTISGGQGNDLLYGGDGDDKLSDNDYDGGNDRVYGGSGHDTLRAGQGDDYIYGGHGNDVFDFREYKTSGGTVIVPADSGDDTISGGPGRDSFYLSKAGGKVRITDFDPQKDQIFTQSGSYEDVLDRTLRSVPEGVRFVDGKTVVLLAEVSMGSLRTKVIPESGAPYWEYVKPDNDDFF